MEQLKNTYINKYELLSNNSNKLWKIGVFFDIPLFLFIYSLINNLYIKIFIATIAISVFTLLWYAICLLVYYKEIQRNIKKKLGKLELKGDIECIEKKLDEYQKQGILKHVRNNNLEDSSKLNIVINELQKEINESFDKKIKDTFIIPGILGIFTSIVTYSPGMNHIVYILLNTIAIGSCIGFVYSLYMIYECKTFSKYYGKERLKEILIYISLNIN